MKINDIAKWRTEIALAEEFRDNEFGKLNSTEVTGAGENINYYENGFSEATQISDYMVTTINVIDALVSIVVPSLYFRNPRTIALPEKIESEGSAPIAAKVIDFYRKKSDAEEVNKKNIWDAYVLGMGVYKIGYTTKFGTDIRDEEKEKEREKSKNIIDKALEVIGLKEKKEDEVVRPETDIRIVSESPFIQYISPFDFLIDPRAKNINEAQWVAHKVTKTLKEVKENPKYSNTKNLKGSTPEIKTLNNTDIGESAMDEFKVVDLYEIHYRGREYFYMLTLAKDGDEFKELYHDVSIYELGEWQFDILSFKKHGHTLYPKSDITKIKNLQDRITSTIDAILEQVDKFVPKLAYEAGGISPTGRKSLQDGGIGALVECTKNPKEVFQELNFTQLKTDLQRLIDQLITLITIQTGLTRAQLTGVSDSGTATEAQIEQGGSTIRLSDMSNMVQGFVNRQSRKLWKVIRQFTPLEELELINGIKGVDENTGLPKYDWLTIDYRTSDRLREGNYDFNIEVGSTEKISLAVVRKAFENLFNILARTEVIALIQQQGDKVALSEILRRYFDLFPEMGVDSGKIIQKITPTTTGLVDPMMLSGKGGMTEGSQANQMRSMRAEGAPTMPQMMQTGAQI